MTMGHSPALSMADDIQKARGRIWGETGQCVLLAFLTALAYITGQLALLRQRR